MSEEKHPSVTFVSAGMELRDYFAAACLPAIYEHMTQITDRAADLAYEQADEMMRARERGRG